MTRMTSTGTLRTVTAAAAAMSALVLAAACANNPEPRVTKPASTAHTKPTATPSPTATTPTKRPTSSLDAELHATATAFYAAFVEARNTYDTSAFLKLGAKGCAGCQSYIESVRKAEQHQYTYSKSAKYTITSFHVVKNLTDNQRSQEANFTLTLTGIVEYDNTGKVRRKVENERHAIRMQFTRSGSRWIVAEQYVD